MYNSASRIKRWERRIKKRAEEKEGGVERQQGEE
jgi:hypothetical protein